MIHII